jgi:hypothetical protein
MATLILAGAAVVQAVQSFHLGAPYVPRVWPLLALAILGAGLAAAVPRRLVGAAARLPALGAALGVLLGLALVPTARGYVKREARADPLAGALTGWLVRQPRWAEGAEPVWITNGRIAALAGDELRHPLELLGEREPCESVDRLAPRRWVVIARSRLVPRDTAPVVSCFGGRRPDYTSSAYLVFAPRGG